MLLTYFVFHCKNIVKQRYRLKGNCISTTSIQFLIVYVDYSRPTIQFGAHGISQIMRFASYSTMMGYIRTHNGMCEWETGFICVQVWAEAMPGEHNIHMGYASYSYKYKLLYAFNAFMFWSNNQTGVCGEVQCINIKIAWYFQNETEKF